MKPVLFYILQVIIASGLLYCYYHFALRNKKFHRYNRFYLLMTALISSFIPFLKIPVYFSEETTQASAVFKTLNVISSPSFEIESPVIQIDQVQTQSSPLINADNILYIIYFIIVSFLIVRILLSINKIKLITKKYPIEQFDKIMFVNTDEPGTPFSFFRWLFWNRRIELNSEKGEQIFRHELFHIQQKHSWDIIFIEVISTVFWINPFFHLIKKEIKAIHEFLADEFAIKENKNWEYAELLLMQALNTNTHLVNPFFHNQIKRRIAMITLSKKPSYQYLRKIMVLPIAVLIVALCAFTYKSRSKNANNEFEKTISPITLFQKGNNRNDTIPKVDGVYIINKLEPFKKQSPSSAQLNSWTDAKIYGVWMDGKRIDNAQLKNYSSSDFSHFFVSKLTKSALNYGKHYYQVDLMTNDYYQNYLKTFDYDKQIKFLISKDTVPRVLNKYKDYLIAVDGVIKDRNCLDTMPADMIRSIAILKDKSAIDKYGERGKNGVIEITTKPKIDSIEIYYNDPNSQKVKEITLTDTTRKPLVVINNKPMPGLKINDLDSMFTPNVIKIINVLSGNAATDKYGNDAKDGAIEINTEYPKDEIKIKEVILESPQTINKTDDNKVFSKVEVEAAFPGGFEGWRKFLNSKLDAHSIEKSGCPPGAYTVVLQFIVHKDGHVTDVKALTNQGYGMEEQAIGIISKSPDWIPAKQNGRNVSAYRKQPITFVIDKKISSMNEPGSIAPYMVSPEETSTIKLEDFKKVKQLKLQKSGGVQNYELVGFRITIDDNNSSGLLKTFVIKGSNFSDELLKLINELDSEIYITIEDIFVKLDGLQRKLAPKVYKAIIITTAPS